MLKFFGMKYTAAILSTNTRKLKINKSCCHFLTPISTKSFVGWGFVPDPTGELTALLRPPAGFRGPTSKGLGEEEESSSFAVERKRKVGARGNTKSDIKLALKLAQTRTLHIPRLTA